METQFGKNLKTLRKAKGWSQTQLADKVGLSQVTISSYESGGAYPQRYDYRKRLIQELGCTEADLFGYDTAGAASTIEYKFQSMDDLIRHSQTLEDDYSAPTINGEIHPIDHLVKKKYPNGLFYRIITDASNLVIPLGSYVYAVKYKQSKKYNGHFCVVDIDDRYKVYKIFDAGENYAFEPHSSNSDHTPFLLNKNSDKFTIEGRIVWFSHDEKGL